MELQANKVLYNMIATRVPPVVPTNEITTNVSSDEMTTAKLVLLFRVFSPFRGPVF